MYSQCRSWWDGHSSEDHVLCAYLTNILGIYYWPKTARCWGCKVKQVLVSVFTVLTVEFRNNFSRTGLLASLDVSRYPALKFFFASLPTKREVISFRLEVWLLSKSEFWYWLHILRNNNLPTPAPMGGEQHSLFEGKISPIFYHLHISHILWQADRCILVLHLLPQFIYSFSKCLLSTYPYKQHTLYRG